MKRASAEFSAHGSSGSARARGGFDNPLPRQRDTEPENG